MASNKTECEPLKDQVLLLALDDRDVCEIQAPLAEAGIHGTVCEDVRDVCGRIDRGAAVVLVTADSVGPASTGHLIETLSEQPGHFDVPLLVLGDTRTGACRALQLLEKNENVIVLERPLCKASLLSTVLFAVRASRRQQELHRRLVERQRQEQVVRGSEKQLKQQKQTLEQRVAERTAEAERRADQLRALAAQLTRAEQRERRRLAQMLHDELQQLLVASRLKLGVLRRRAPDEELKRSFQQIDDVLNEAIDVSRSLTVELSPPILYDAGLAAALEWLGRQTHEKHGLQVDVKADPQAEPQDEELRILLFQAVRELLFNAVKHGKTDRAQVEMIPLEDNRAQILVADPGTGFDPQAMEDAQVSNAGFGLFNLRERLESVGGHLAVDSSPGKGTRATIVAPRFQLPVELDINAPGTSISAAEKTYTSSGPVTKTRVLLADDHDMLREGLASILSEEHDIELVGQAGDGQQAVELAMRVQPDVVVMDVAMPRLNGIEATRRILAALPGTRVIGLSMHQREDMEKAMFEAGAVAYLPKGDSADTLIDTIRSNAPG